MTAPEQKPGQQPSENEGDRIQVGDIEHSKVVAIGRGATAVYQGLSVSKVAELFLKIKREDQPVVWNGRNPYLGLRAFQEGDAAYFFGREKLVDELLQSVADDRFIVIAGPSGSGKSSLARAGLMHALKEGRIEGSQHWQRPTMKPSSDPIAQLALAMARIKGTPAAGEHIRTTGQQNSLALHEQAELALSDDERQRCILLVDQFEEIFTQTKDDSVRAAFINLLMTAAQVEGGRVTVIICIRSDFIPHCAAYDRLNELLGRQFRQIGAMQPEELARAVSLPALNAGVDIKPALVSQISFDMEGAPDALPLMSFALRDLFEAEKTRRGEAMTLTLPAYQHRGGLQKALERHTERIFDAFDETQIELARFIFTRLVEVELDRDGRDTRRTAVLSELIPDGESSEAVSEVVQAFADEGARLITIGRTDDIGERTQAAPAQTTVILAHDRLIEAWPWLRQLVNENWEIIALQNQINNDAQAWTKEQDAGFLYRSGRLIQVEEQLETLTPSLDALSQQFIQASLDQRQKEIEEKEAQRRRTITILATASGVTLVFAAVAFLFYLRSTDSAKVANENLATATAALIVAETANADAVFQSNEAATSEANALAGEATALAAGTAEAKALATSEANANARATAVIEAETSANVAATREQEAIVVGKQALAQSLVANSRALMSGGTPTNQELAQARLLALEGNRLNQEVGRAQDQTLSQGLLYALAIENPYAHQPVAMLTEHMEWVNSAAWKGDGSLLASASNDGMVIIWDTESWQPVTALTNHTQGVNSIAWKGDGSRLASTSSDGTVNIWDTESWQSVITLTEHTGRVDSLFDLDPTHDVKGVAWSTDGSRLASVSSCVIQDLTICSQGEIIIWDTESWQPMTTLTQKYNVNSVVWNGDGSRLASATCEEEDIGGFCIQGKIIIWDTGSWKSVATLNGHEHFVSTVAWKQDGNSLASASADGTVIIWQAGENHPDNWQPMTTLNEHMNNVKSVAWSGDGSRLASASWDNSVIIWDMESWQPVTTLTDHNTEFITNVAWKRDSILASASHNKIIIWQADENQPKSWQPITTLTDQTNGVNSMAWSGDGSRLASASWSGPIIIWEVLQQLP
ncbi:MAG: hypothetical protein GY805_21240 [Chloroflexi bacterium]|nr:hypothetical protein [Chloroflexota bacterium]